MKLKLTKEELEIMPFDDIAYMILKEKGTKMKTTDLFKIICDSLELGENVYANQIADFFTLLATEKRFLQLEQGFWDLRERHTTKINIQNIEEDLDDEIIPEKEELEEKEDIINEYYDDTKDTEDDETEDDLKDLVIIDDENELESDL